MCVHTARAKHTLNLNKMLGENRVLLAEKERDLEMREVQAHGLNTRENRDELLELVELWKHLNEAVVVRIAKARQLVALVEDISNALVDLGNPIQGIPQDPS
jgi:hypothetical protein